MTEKDEKEIIKEIQQIKDEQVVSYSISPLDNEESLKFFKETAGLVSKVYDHLKNRFDDSELSGFQNRVSQLSYIPKSNTHRLIAEWTVKRRDLINNFHSTADQLDQSYMLASFGTIIGSAIDLFHNVDSVFGNHISDALVHQAYSLSTQSGIASQVFFKFAPYLGYMGLFTCLGDAVYSKFKMQGIKKALVEDLELFEKIKEWIEETETLDAEVKKLFPHGIDFDVLAEVENVLSLSDCCTKVFVAALFSNMKKVPLLAKNVNFLCEAFMFSRSEAAEEWYNRNLAVPHPIRFEVAKLDIKNTLFELEKSFPRVQSNELLMAGVGSKVKKGELIAHTIQGFLNCFSIYMSCKDMRERVTNKHSNWLRQLARGSAECLDHILVVQRKLEEINGLAI